MVGAIRSWGRGLSQEGSGTDPNGLIFENEQFLGRFKPFLLH